jgi:LysM repeat protein
MKMTKLIRPFLFSTMIALVLVSCSFSSNETQTAIVQATPTLAATVIQLTVQTNASALTAVGQVIKYTYTVKNAGAASVPGPVTVTGATCPELKTMGNSDAVFDPNEILTCTSEYTITQADLDRASVTSIATAIVSGINSNPVTTAVVSAPPAVLKLTKTASPVTYDRVGLTITYIYVITNSGTATLGPAQFVVTDTGIPTPINCGEATLTLAPNAFVSCSAIYAVTQADMDSGTIAANAIASGGGVAASQPANATITKGVLAQSNPNFTAGSTVKHQVLQGEWLWQIARCYGADPNAVIAANQPTPAEISPNTTVTVPNIGSAGKIYGPPCIGTHTVQSGDTWASIALKYNADAAVLQMVNKNILTVGQTLTVPLNSAGVIK